MLKDAAFLIKILASEEKISLDDVFLQINSPENGAVNFFVGTVRNHTKGKSVRFLDYEAYAPMAEKEARKICEEVFEKFSASRIIFLHRTGRLFPGEVAVVIATTCAHREDSFAACRYVIEEVKKRVPIWKKEYFEDGEVWVSAFP
jgi:molybdopterin synthase catalytic subunit